MGTITRGAKAGGGTNFNSGQTIDPAEVNTDFNTIVTELNGLLDDGNLETATLPGAKSLRFTEISAPSSPSSNDLLVYAKDLGGVSTLYTKDSAGTETALTGSSMPRSYLAGLGLSQAVDTDHDITVAAGAARDSTNAADMVLASAITKQIDAAWAVGTNAGGLDTGAVGNATWYHLWLIKRSDTGVVDALFSTSVSAPTMPTSYDYRRRIGAVLTDGAANIIAFTQVGDSFLWTTPILDLTADATEAATLRTLSVPLGVAVEAIYNVVTDWSAAEQVLYLSCPDQADVAPSQSAAPLGQLSNEGAGDQPMRQVVTRTNTSSQIRTRAIGTFDGNALNIATLGWYDTRGRDS